MVRKRRILLASVVASAILIAVPDLLFFIDAQTPYLNSDGTPDNAPLRGVGVFLLISPIFFLIAVLLFFLAGLVLQRSGFLKPRILAVLCFLVSTGIAATFTLAAQLGLRDALVMFAVTVAAIFTDLALAISVWWAIALGSNNSFKPKPLRGSA